VNEEERVKLYPEDGSRNLVRNYDTTLRQAQKH